MKTSALSVLASLLSLVSFADETATNAPLYIDAGFTQDLPALAPNLCGWVAGSFYDSEKGEDHYYVWFNREMDAPPSMCARIVVSERGTNWLDGTWVDWAVTNWIDKATGREWTRPYSAEVEYLESTGTQYINTLVQADSSMAYNFRFSLRRMPTDTYALAFGSINNSPATDGVALFLNYTVNVQSRFGKNSAPNIVSNLRVQTGLIYDGVLELNRLYLNGVNYSPSSPNLWVTPGNPICVFASIANLSRRFTALVFYHFSISRGQTDVIDFIPVLDLAGRPAMYDRVSGQLFYNQGTGDFSYGPVTAAPVPCRELVVPRRNANCVLKTGTVITLGGKDGFDADIHKVNIEVGGTPTPTTSAQLPLFYAVTRSGTNTVTRAYTNGFINVENGFVKEPTNE